MKTPDRPAAGDHPQVLFLPFLEGLLSREDQAVVENHISTCDVCSSDMQALQMVVEKLKTNKEALCPEPWQLYEFAETRQDPNGALSGHLKECRLCSEEVLAYTGATMTASMTAKVKEAYYQHFPRAIQSRVHEGVFASLFQFLGRFSEIFRIPALALGTVAATILVVVVLYPRSSIEPFIGLSSVTWEQKEAASSRDRGLIPKSGLFDEQKPRLALILVFKGFTKPVPQARIDSLYEALRPTPESDRRFSFVAPADLKTAIAEVSFKPGDRGDLLHTLFSKLGVSKAIVLEVSPKNDRFEIRSEMLNAETGAIMQSRPVMVVSDVELPGKLNESVSFLTEPDHSHLQ